MREIVIIIIVIFVLGCAWGNTSKNLNKVSVGMSKQQVIDVMGEPSYVSAKDGIEYLTYLLYPPPPYHLPTGKSPYFVRLMNGKVDSYGKTGDFDSTKDPTLNININK